MKSLYSFPQIAIMATAFLVAFAGSARGITTTWTADFADWSVPANWSAGEPTTGDDAIVPAGAALVTQPGEGCASLQVGLGGTPGAVQIITGALEVLGTLQVGDTGSGSSGTFSQSGGTVTAETLDLTSGAFGLNIGDFTTATSVLRLGGTFSVTLDGQFTNTGAFTVEFGAAITVTGGSLEIGTDPGDQATIRGTFNYSATPQLSFQNLTFTGDGAVFHVQLSDLGLATITVAGALNLDGTLQIIDTMAPEGRYDIITAGAVGGAFDSVIFPAGDWSWGIENTTLYVTKGQGTPVAQESWGQVKAAFAR